MVRTGTLMIKQYPIVVERCKLYRTGQSTFSGTEPELVNSTGVEAAGRRLQN